MAICGRKFSCSNFGIVCLIQRRQYTVLVCLIWTLKSWFWGKLFIISVKRCGAFLCLFGLDDTFPLPVNMSLKYSGMVPFLYL